LPDLGLLRELGGASFGEFPPFGDDIGVVAQRKRHLHVLLDQQYGHARRFQGLQRARELLHDDGRQSHAQRRSA
jgi:hypothetical protein